MLTKGKITLFMTLCILSLVSIGFASWTISEESKEEVLGSMQTDNVINSAEFVCLDYTKGDIDEESSTADNTVRKGYTVFNYGEYGYLDENGVTTSTANMIVYLTLDVERCNELFGSDFNSMKVNVRLSYTSTVNTKLNLFKNSTPTSLGQHSFSANYQDQSEGVTINYTNVSDQYELTQQYTCELAFVNILSNYKSNSIPGIDESGKIKFAINYQLNATTGEYFYQEIFQTMYMDGLDTNNLFEVSLMVSAYNS